MQLATGEVPVLRTKIPADDRGVDQTVALMMRMARGIYGGKSPRIRALAINIINQAGVRDKDYYGMAEAIHNWVRDEIRYVKDPVGQETLSYPEETAFNTRAGDCDDKTILEMALLASLGIHSYPVVISTHPSGTFSHVYLHVIIPEGSHPHAGEIVPADPIMRQWPFGREAGDERVTRRKLYRHLIKEGTIMRKHPAGIDEIEGLGAYASAQSYLDEENSADVRRALESQITLTTPHRDNNRIRKDSDELIDTIFRPMEDNRILARGPMTAGGAAPGIKKLETKHKSFSISDRLNFRPSITLLTPHDIARHTRAEALINVAKALEQENKNCPSTLSIQAQPITLRLTRNQAFKAKRRAAITGRPQDIEIARKFNTAYQLSRRGMRTALQTPLAREAVRVYNTLNYIGDDTIEFLSGLGELERHGEWSTTKIREKIKEKLKNLLSAMDTLFKEGVSEREITEIVEKLGLVVAPKYIAIKKLPNNTYMAFGINDPPLNENEELTYYQIRYDPKQKRYTTTGIPITSIVHNNTLYIPLINQAALKVVFNAIQNKNELFTFRV